MFNENMAAIIFKKNFPDFKIVGAVKFKDGYVFSFAKEGKENDRLVGNTVFIGEKTRKVQGFSIAQHGSEFFRATRDSQIDVSTLLQ